VTLKTYIFDFIRFGLKQFRAAIFGFLIILGLAITQFVRFSFIERYDLLLIYVILIQIILLITHYEQPYDLIPIMIFHVLGMALEIYKVQWGSWSYPDDGFFVIMGVPLYSAFMYSAIGSYIVRIIKEMNIRVTHWPKLRWTLLTSFLIYLNFFTNVRIYDYRDWLYVLIILVFWRVKFGFTARVRRHEWPAILGFFLIGLFIYFAENIGSFFNAWRYSYQLSHWRLVDAGKISSWVLLIIVTIVIVIELQHYFSGKIKNVNNIID
jgi:uncharacterized membrane protein YoaT (DUF817 family)